MTPCVVFGTLAALAPEIKFTQQDPLLSILMVTTMPRVIVHSKIRKPYLIAMDDQLEQWAKAQAEPFNATKK